MSTKPRWLDLHGGGRRSHNSGSQRNPFATYVGADRKEGTDAAHRKVKTHAAPPSPLADVSDEPHRVPNPTLLLKPRIRCSDLQGRGAFPSILHNLPLTIAELRTVLITSVRDRGRYS